jgi:pimeloyl-ACP methyl ester carboxylesterase
MRVIVWVLKWIVRLVGLILLFLVAFLSISRGLAAVRENRSASEVAPANGQFVEVAGQKIHLQVTGPEAGPPVVFVHGMGAWSELWRTTIDEVGKAGFRAIAIDLPPFGFSERPTDAKYGRIDQARRIIGILDALKIPRAVLVGHSFGGGPTMEAALRAKDRVIALVLADPAIGLDDPPMEPGLTAALVSVRPLRNAVLSATATNPLLTRFLLTRFVARTEAATPERIAVLRRPLVLKGATNALGDWLVAFMTPETGVLSQDPAAYASFDRQTLLIWGELDTTTPLAQGTRLDSVIPQSELVVLKGIGHMPQIEDPPAFNQALLRFLEPFTRARRR